jgi:2-methylisocitrate lyase-like PEP mutase family enzyme
VADVQQSPGLGLRGRRTELAALDRCWLRCGRVRAGCWSSAVRRESVFLGPFLTGAEHGAQEGLVPEALRRANAYSGAGADCVYPIALWETDALRRFTSAVSGPVNVVHLPQSPSLAELAAVGVARVSWGPFLYLDAMARSAEQLASLQG